MDSGLLALTVLRFSISSRAERPTSTDSKTLVSMTLIWLARARAACSSEYAWAEMGVDSASLSEVAEISSGPSQAENPIPAAKPPARNNPCIVFMNPVVD